MIKPGKCFGSIPVGTLGKVTYLVEAISRAGKEQEGGQKRFLEEGNNLAKK